LETGYFDSRPDAGFYEMDYERVLMKNR